MQREEIGSAKELAGAPNVPVPLNGINTFGLKPGTRIWAQDKNERARQYRHRAEEILAAADTVRLEETRLTLVSLADSYQHMADTLDHLHLVDQNQDQH